ncbi:ketoacyl-ACP synthase III family protein [Kitasatospora sp. NA04385]|uniref:ketoacyl-ACP synthase III family protein n=1 Tax=Kitasatospora sp. NA04385 TaxID=2742135 RepID=UPI00159186C4|nr:ketoacyl-ACP synthase III family protein [Kitasatospora sp. NA04385]QKW21676.1 ketoacyl-ACP synthase III family protein [Kitasatospora sp. NA04385]
MQVDSVFFRALGTHVPESVPPPAPDAQSSEEGGLTGALVAGDVAPPELAARAVRQAFARGAVDPADIGLLLHASVFHQGPDGWLPPSYIARETLGTDVPAIEVRQGCNGLFSALELAIGRLVTDPSHPAALLTSAENFDSPLVDRWTAHPGSYLGDAGVALVIDRRGGFARLRSLATVSVPQLEQLHRGAEPLFPPGATAGRPLDFGARVREFAELKLVPDGQELLGKARDEVLARVLAESGTQLDEVAWVVSMNNSRPHVAKRLIEPLGLPMERSGWEFGRGFGHLGASDQFVTLERIVAAGRVAPGDRVLMLGVGPGISIGAAVVEILEVPDWS